MALSEPLEGGALQDVTPSAANESAASPAAGSTAFGQDVINSIQSISQNVEMTDFSKSTTNQPPAEQDIGESGKATSTTTGPSSPLPTQTPLIPSAMTSSDSAIGPATDKPTMQHTSSASGPQLFITLLLHSTETRHPYTIDEAYLKRRNVSVADNNPVNMSVYTLKELILRDWRQEWEPRPASPTSIRLIHMGRMLDDKAYLKDSRFSIGDAPHIVHMTIKPQEVVDEEDARIAKGGGRDRDGNERSPGCRCVLM